MLYIKKDRRKDFDPELNKIYENIQVPGDLCYCIYKLLNDLTHKKYVKNFTTMSALLAEVECAKLEFYRRVVVTYEDTKIIENGDV